MKEEIYWTNRSGEKISVDNMDTVHLRNVLKMLLRETSKKIVVRNIKSFKLNGDMAEQFNESFDDIDEYYNY